MSTAKAPIPGWRTMTSAQRHNAKMDRIWAAAKDAKTRFNESSRTETDNPVETLTPEDFQFDRNCQNWGMREDAVRRGIPVSDIGTQEAYNAHNLPDAPTCSFDYENQAWVVDGRYVSCGHPETMKCGCFGRIHAGEPPAANAEMH